LALIWSISTTRWKTAIWLQAPLRRGACSAEAKACSHEHT
jgi:hypothetical protein